MKRSIQSDFRRLAILLLVAIVLALPVARAQMRLAGPTRVALQAGKTAQQPSAPQANFALIGPGPIGAATTTNLFAQVAFGQGYTTLFTFMNTGPDATTGNLILTSNNGLPLTAAFTSPGAPNAIGSTYPISVPSGGSQLITSNAVNPALDPLSVGWGRVESSGGSLGGVATFQFSIGGSLSTIVGVISSTAASAATFPADDDHSQARDTGYAVVNPGNKNINIKIVLMHPDGTVHLTISPPALNPLPPGGHVATFLWQDLNDQFLLFRGTVVLIEQSSQQFTAAALVLNKGLLTAIPVIPTKAPGIN